MLAMTFQFLCSLCKCFFLFHLRTLPMSWRSKGYAAWRETMSVLTAVPQVSMANIPPSPPHLSTVHPPSLLYTSHPPSLLYTPLILLHCYTHLSSSFIATHISHPPSLLHTSHRPSLLYTPLILFHCYTHLSHPPSLLYTPLILLHCYKPLILLHCYTQLSSSFIAIHTSSCDGIHWQQGVQEHMGSEEDQVETCST